jgi:hypothetical protein
MPLFLYSIFVDWMMEEPLAADIEDPLKDGSGAVEVFLGCMKLAAALLAGLISILKSSVEASGVLFSFRGVSL